MTFTYKLARRLAVLPIGIVVAAVLGSCAGEDQMLPVDPSEPSLSRNQLGRVTITPDSLTLEAGQRSRFAAYRIVRGDTARLTVQWSASGGTITPDGVFFSAIPGKFKVIGTMGTKRWYTAVDSAAVVVVPSVPNLVRVVVAPDTATVVAGATRKFTAVGKLSDSSTTPIGITWSATGGAVDEAGGYTAGTTAGTYQVIATNTAGDRADTATVTIPAQAPVSLASVIVVPASVTVAPGGTQQFAAYGKLSNGDSVAAAVTWAATGGTIGTGGGPAGLFTAGQVAGAFRVTATAEGRADTATVTVTAAPPPAPSNAAVSCTHYVAPNGVASGGGTQAAPWSMAYVLWQNAGGQAGAGDTICVRAGTYSTSLVGEVAQIGRTSLAGSSTRPLVMRAYPGEHVILDGGLSINGPDTWWWGFDFTYSGWTSRTSGVASSWPEDIRGPLTSLTVHGARTKIINCTVHDLGGGIESWEDASDAEIYGNLIYYIGWLGPDRGHGHSTYTQSTTGTRHIIDNFMWDGFSNGNNAYGSDAVQLRNVELIGNTGWNHGYLGNDGYGQFLMGAGGSNDNLTFTNNVAYDSYGGAALVRFGYDPTASNSHYTIKDNYLIGGEPVLRLWNLTQSTFTGNTTWGAGTCGACRMDLQKNTAGWTWGGNTYYGSPTTPEWGYNSSGYTWAAWRAATGLGAGDTYLPGKPTGLKIFTRPNKYEPGRANITVFSFSGATTASLDLTGIGLQPGQAYEVRNAQNYYAAPVATGTGPGSVTVPLGGLTKAPLKASSRVPFPTGAAFNTFVVVPR